MLSDVSQSHQDKYHMLLLLLVATWAVQLVEMEIGRRGARGCGEVDREFVLIGDRVSVLQDQTVLWVDGGGGRKTVGMYLMSMNCT